MLPTESKAGGGAPVPPRVPRTKRRNTPLWLKLLLLAAVAGAGYVAYPRLKPILFPERLAEAPPQRPIPVVTAPVERGNMDLYLNGLGTVVGFNTVTVRSRVEGELVKVAFSEGQMVHEGDLLAEIDPRPFEIQLQEAQAQLARDEAALKLAQADLDRYEPLAVTKTITQQQLETQRALVQQSKATLQADQGRIDNIRLQLNYCRIVAPISGRIGLRTVDPGNMVRANEPMGLAVIAQLQPISVVFTIPQDHIAAVQKSMRDGHQPLVDAFNRGFDSKLGSGKLEAIDNQVDVTTGTVRLKAIFPNDDNLLFPNQFVNARLLVETLRDVILVPSAAIQHGPNFTFVFVVKSDSTVDLRTVMLGPTEGDVTVVASGVSAGESVVVDGVDKLQQGTKVVARDQSPSRRASSEARSEGADAKGY